MYILIYNLFIKNIKEIQKLILILSLYHIVLPTDRQTVTNKQRDRKEDG